MIIKNWSERDLSEVKAEMRVMSHPHLLAQYLLQRGATDAVAFALSKQPENELLTAMKRDLAALLMFIHEVANARGIVLPGYE
jgi:hypothetical protein